MDFKNIYLESFNLLVSAKRRIYKVTLFFKKQNLTNSIDFTKDIPVVLDISDHSDIKKQIAMIHLTKNDLAILHHLQPFVQQILDVTVTSFYKSLESESKLMDIITTHSSVERLKKTLYSHLLEMFSGVIDSNYLNQRKIIAHVHVKIGLEPKWYMAAFETLNYEFLKYIMTLTISDSAKRDALAAISKILNLEQQLVLEAYEAENMRMRIVEQLQKDKVKIEVHDTAENLAAVSEETSASINKLSYQATNIKESTNQNLSFVQDTEEKSQSGQILLTRQMEQMRLITESINALQIKMVQLQDSSNRIRNIVGLVTSIANQTNLLALNAAIEAARAGEHGVGFAVVASEVRKLSEDTKKAIESVESLIQETDDGIGDITKSVSEMNHLIADGADKYEQMSESYQNIVQAMSGIKIQSEQSNTEIATISEILNELNQAVETIAISSDGLINTINDL
ncbi:globin-coupled sensor protein [Psychrobacillus glaciei]|uniref:Globin-coupled sensor protein n=1 Tax=Psychrobacillus glaciei TaxID=2283160 RepID=A0A5J6SVG1_9BACI|nr:globin-coupled sensor protein [Psychrobacillus glaciei]